MRAKMKDAKALLGSLFWLAFAGAVAYAAYYQYWGKPAQKVKLDLPPRVPSVSVESLSSVENLRLIRVPSTGVFNSFEDSDKLCFIYKNRDTKVSLMSCVAGQRSEGSRVGKK